MNTCEPHNISLCNQYLRYTKMHFVTSFRPQKMEKVIMIRILKYLEPEAVTRTCSVKNILLKISQNSQENTCARVSFLVKLQA